MNGGDLLETIVAATRRRVETARDARPRDVLLAQIARGADDAAGRPSFREAVQRRDRTNVIAECKRRSPSRGVIRERYDPGALATAYAAAGAAAISVLTEPTFFDGTLEHLRQVVARVPVPVLRKDFVVDPYQIAEAREAGASAVLLIVAALSDRELQDLLTEAAALDLDALVEVHDEAELSRACAAGAPIVGVNNRNLRTLEVDTGVSQRLAAVMPSEVVAVAESGFRTRDELRALQAAGYDAFLIGEHLMTSTDPGESLRRLVER